MQRCEFHFCCVPQKISKVGIIVATVTLKRKKKKRKEKKRKEKKKATVAFFPNSVVFKLTAPSISCLL